MFHISHTECWRNQKPGNANGYRKKITINSCSLGTREGAGLQDRKHLEDHLRTAAKYHRKNCGCYLNSCQRRPSEQPRPSLSPGLNRASQAPGRTGSERTDTEAGLSSPQAVRSAHSRRRLYEETGFPPPPGRREEHLSIPAEVVSWEVQQGVRTLANPVVSVEDRWGAVLRTLNHPSQEDVRKA